MKQPVLMNSRGHWEFRGPEGRRLSDDAVGRPRGATKLLRIFLEKLMAVNEEKKDGRGNFLLTLGTEAASGGTLH